MPRSYGQRSLSPRSRARTPQEASGALRERRGFRAVAALFGPIGRRRRKVAPEPLGQRTAHGPHTPGAVGPHTLRAGYLLTPAEVAELVAENEDLRARVDELRSQIVHNAPAIVDGRGTTWGGW